MCEYSQQSARRGGGAPGRVAWLLTDGRKGMSWLGKFVGAHRELAHSQVAVARFLLVEAAKRDFVVTPMKLQKLVFLAHAWMLALYGMPLVGGRLEAWDFGPVFPALYRRLKHRGAEPLSAADLPESDEAFEDDVRELLVWIVERYGPLTAAQLSRLTHRKNSPWELSRRHGRNERISTQMIRFYYTTLLRRMQADSSLEQQRSPA